MSADGRKVAFISSSSQLGPTDSPRSTEHDDEDVYVRDLDTGTTADLYLLDLSTGAYELVSTNATATASGNRRSGSLTVLGSGRSGFSAGSRIVFVSEAGDLSPGGTYPGLNVFVAHHVVFDEADLAVSGSATPDETPVGEAVTYRVTVTNDGPAAAENVTLRFEKPDGMAARFTESVGTCEGWARDRRS